MQKVRVKTEAETGVMWPQAKKRKEHPGIGGGRKNSALEAFEVAWPCWHLDSGRASSNTLRREVSAALSRPVALRRGNPTTNAGSTGAASGSWILIAYRRGLEYTSLWAWGEEPGPVTEGGYVSQWF